MDYDKLEELNFDESIVVRCEKIDNDIIFEYLDYGTAPVRFIFKNVECNKDIDEGIAADLLKYNDYLDDKNIEMMGAEYGEFDESRYFLRLYLLFVPDEWYDYSNLKLIKYPTISSMETPMISFVFDELIIEELNVNFLDYSRENINYRRNLYSIENKIDDDLFDLLSSYMVNCVFKGFEYDNNDLLISYVNEDDNSNFILKFNNIWVIDDTVENLLAYIDKGRIYPERIRIIDIKDDKYIVGFLLSRTCELKIICDDVVLDNNNFKFDSFYNFIKIWNRR